MDVSLDERSEALVVNEGRYASASAVIADGLKLLEEREARLGALRATLDAAIARGGSHYDDEVAAAVTARLGALSIPDAAE
jgi:antitoxin ParD1/3/4